MRAALRTHIRQAILSLAVCGLAMGSSAAKASSHPIYNDQANPRQEISAAISKASKTGRNIVLIFGANW